MTMDSCGRHNKIGNYVTAERCSRDRRVLDKKDSCGIAFIRQLYAGARTTIFLYLGQQILTKMTVWGGYACS